MQGVAKRLAWGAHMGWPDRIRVLERGWLSSNQLVFVDDDGASVLDTGYVSEADETLRLLDTALAGMPLRRIFNTHIHSDHAGGNAALQARHPGCRTLIPPGEAQAVAAWDTTALSHDRLSQDCPRFTHDGVFHPGETLHLGGEDWAVLPAPGHDHAMVMLWCERLGLLASADALWQRGFGVVFPELDGVSGFAEQAPTLDAIGQLAPRWVVPGHGAPFGGAAVDEALVAARARIAWLASDPRAHGLHALKVLIAFKLMAARQLSRAALTAIVQTRLDAGPGLRAALADSRGEPPEAASLATLLCAQLADAGVLRMAGGVAESTR